MPIQPYIESWRKIADDLETAIPFAEWQEAPWLRVVYIDEGRMLGRLKAYELVESPHVLEIELAVEKWIKGETLPKLEHPASYLLALRFHTVSFLLRSLDGIVLPPPREQIREMYRKFLIDWWRRVGGNYAVGSTCVEYDPKPPLQL